MSNNMSFGLIHQNQVKSELTLLYQTFKMKRKVMDRLSDLPDSVLNQILSLFLDKKAIVRSSILSKRWRFLWKSVPQSLRFYWFPGGDVSDFVSSIYRELYYAKLFKKTQKFFVQFRYLHYNSKDVDIWLLFATQANVEHFTLQFSVNYELPQFVYKNSSFTNLVLTNCQIKPSGSINWSNLTSLSIGELELTDGVMQKILSGCPNLECLELDSFCGINRLEIGSEKLRNLIIRSCAEQELEILAPYVQNLQILESCGNTRLLLRDVASLVAVVLDFAPFLWYRDEEDKLERMCSCFKELLHSVAHVENLEMGPWCIELLSLLELKGWPSPPSSRKFLKLNTALEQLDFPGFCSLLQSSADLETLVIDWKINYKSRKLFSKFKNDEYSKRFQTHNCNCSLLHLKTIKIIQFPGALSENKFELPLVQYLLKNAVVLEKLAVAAGLKGIDMSRDYVEMEQEFLSFPRSSLHASIVFSNK